LNRYFFISDLHLDTIQSPRRTSLFLSFLDFVRHQQGDIYILGDLFDYWVNNRKTFQKNRPILEGLAGLRQSGCRVSLLWGNRDFLLKKNYLARFGIMLLPEIHSQTIQEYNILMTHGHCLCAEDSKFQRYRRRWWRVFRLLDLILPGELEDYAAKLIRHKSRQVVSDLTEVKLCLSEEMLQQYFNQGFDVVVCGHTHHPKIKQYPYGKRLIVLPSWNVQGGYCLLEEGDFKLLAYTDTQ
jgi:UDP-2,3-diacylglucosamine hydrolase